MAAFLRSKWFNSEKQCIYKLEWISISLSISFNIDETALDKGLTEHWGTAVINYYI